MILLILLGLNFTLFILAFLFILLDVLKAKKKSKEGSKKKGISRLSGYSYGFGILSMIMLIFIGAILTI